MKKTCPVCGRRGHTTVQYGTDSKALAASDFKCSRDGEDADLSGMMTVGQTSGDSAKVAADASNVMTWMDYRASDCRRRVRYWPIERRRLRRGLDGMENILA